MAVVIVPPTLTIRVQILRVTHAPAPVPYVRGHHQLSVRDVIQLKIVKSTPPHLAVTAKPLSTLLTIKTCALRSHQRHVLKTTCTIPQLDSA